MNIENEEKPPSHKKKGAKHFFFTARFSSFANAEQLCRHLRKGLTDLIGLLPPIAMMRTCYAKNLSESGFVIEGTIYGSTLHQRIMQTIDIHRRLAAGVTSFLLEVKMHPDMRGADFELWVYPNHRYKGSQIAMYILGILWIPLSLVMIPFTALFLAPMLLTISILLVLSGKREVCRKMLMFAGLLATGPLPLLLVPPVGKNPKEYREIMKIMREFPTLTELKPMRDTEASVVSGDSSLAEQLRLR